MAKTETPKKSKLQELVEFTDFLAEEVRENGQRFAQDLAKFKKLGDPHSEEYFDLLSELWVEADVVRLKAVHAKQGIDRLLNYLENHEELQQARKNPRTAQFRARHDDQARRRAS